MTDFTINKRVINFVQQSEGLTLSDVQIKAISEGSSGAPRIFNGCIQGLSYGQSQELEQVILSTVEDSIKRKIVLAKKSDARVSDMNIDARKNDLIIEAKNINKYERVLKNAIDFGHQPCIIIEDYNIIWCTLLPFKCPSEDITIRAFSAGDSRHSRGG